VPPEGAHLYADGACNHQTQEGCSPGQACRPRLTADGGLEPGCQEAGSTRTRAPCDDWADCTPGDFCAVEADAGAGVCQRLCCGGDWTVCPEGESCFRPLSIEVDGGPVESGAYLCHPVTGCDVLDPLTCAAEPGKS
jgi:hypothetical protein